LVAATNSCHIVGRVQRDNLIKLAKLFEISVDVLLDNKEMAASPDREKISTGKTPCSIVSLFLCVIAYGLMFIV
jgi:hypothetical protein